MVPDLHQIDVTHTIHNLAFGAQFPGQINPLDGKTLLQKMIWPAYSCFHTLLVLRN